MFRELLRTKQKLPREECDALLRTSLRGTLSLNGEDGYPYALPIDYFYDPECETVYFHSGKVGYKVDCIDRSEKACFTVSNDGERLEGEWWLTVKSVILFGKIRKITDLKEITEISRKLSYKFTQDEEYIERELREYSSATLLLALRVEHMIGKIVREK